MCARKPCVGSTPQTGALLQYITGGGAGLTSCTFGRRGTARKGAGRPPRYGRLRDGSRPAESEDELALVFGVERRRAVPFVGTSPRVDRHDDDWAGGVRDDELAARNVEVDAKRELFDPPGYGEGKDSVRHAWSGGRRHLGGICYAGGRVKLMWRGRVGHHLLAQYEGVYLKGWVFRECFQYSLRRGVRRPRKSERAVGQWKSPVWQMAGTDSPC